MEIFFCDKCGIRLSDGDIERGDAERQGSYVYCKACMKRAAGAQGAAAPSKSGTHMIGKPQPQQTQRISPIQMKSPTAGRGTPRAGIRMRSGSAHTAGGGTPGSGIRTRFVTARAAGESASARLAAKQKSSATLVIVLVTLLVGGILALLLIVSMSGKKKKTAGKRIEVDMKAPEGEKPPETAPSTASGPARPSARQPVPSHAEGPIQAQPQPPATPLSPPPAPAPLPPPPPQTLSGALRSPDNPATAAAGLSYEYYESPADLKALPDFGTLKPVKTGTAKNFDLVGVCARKENVAVRFAGYVDMLTAGTYTFYLNSADGSKLFIGDTLVVDNDGTHMAEEKSGRIDLKAGKHAIAVAYFNSSTAATLEVRYQGPGVAKDLIPDVALFCRPGSGGGGGASAQTPAAAEPGPPADPFLGQGVLCESGDAGRWVIYAGAEKGAKVRNPEAGSKAVVLAGGEPGGKPAGFRLKNMKGADEKWNDTGHARVSWQMKSSEPYWFYVVAGTDKGMRYLEYVDGIDKPAARVVGGVTYIRAGIGRFTLDGDWHAYVRDAAKDLAAAEPGNKLKSIDWICVRGSVSLDNLRLLPPE